MSRLNETESAIFISLVCSLLPVDLHSELSIFLVDKNKNFTTFRSLKFYFCRLNSEIRNVAAIFK